MPIPHTTVQPPRSATDTAAAAVTASAADTERAVLDAVIAAVLDEHPAGGMVDSHRVAAAFTTRRRAAGADPDPQQTKDYVQYLFRESAAHVCRHADNAAYRIHPEAQCTPDCDTKHHHRAATPVREHCSSCHMELTTTGDCPLGC